MKYLTVVYQLPNESPASEFTRHDRTVAASWSHAIHDRDAEQREAARLRAEVDALRQQKLVLEYPPPDLPVYEAPKPGDSA
jgi:hypothetical protein